MSQWFLVSAVFALVSALVLYLLYRAAWARIEMAPSFRTRFWLITYVAVLGGMLLTIFLGFSAVEDMARITREDGAAEWATSWTALAAAVFFVANGWRHRHGGILAFSLVMAAFCFFIAGEEIAWGQRFLELQSPEFFSENNLQDEVTVHNLQIGSVKVHGWAQVLGPPMVLIVFVLAQAAFPERVKRLTGVRLTPPVAGVAVLFSIYFFVASYPFPGDDVERNVSLFEAPVRFFQAHSSPQSELSELLFAGLLLMMSASLVTRPKHLDAANDHRVEAPSQVVESSHEVS